MSDPVGPEQGARRKAAVEAWVASARADLVAAHVLSKEDRETIDATVVAFHAQQCVEKALKAWLLHMAVDFRPTHDLNVLLDLVPPASRVHVDPTVGRLTQYAVAQRYPAPSNDPLALIDGPDWAEAGLALDLAQATLDMVSREVLVDPPDGAAR